MKSLCNKLIVLRFAQPATCRAGKTAGETRSTGGSAGDSCRDCQKSVLALQSRETALFPAVSAAVPLALPPTLRLSPAFSATVLGISGSGPVAGRGNRNYSIEGRS